MTLFAEKLQTLRNPAWAPHYIGYAELKILIAAIVAQTEKDGVVGSEEEQIASDNFLAELERQIGVVDAFVAKQKKTYDATFHKLQIAAGKALKDLPTLSPPEGADAEDPQAAWSVKDAMAQLNALPQEQLKTYDYLCSLRDLTEELVAIRHYVGTNVIAATKIVKKHDKNVHATLAKSRTVADLVKSKPFYTDTALPILTQEVEDALADALHQLYRGEPKPRNSPRKTRPRGSSLDESDKSLSGDATTWLVQGAEVDGQDTDKFVDTYLVGWRFTKKAEGTEAADGGDDPWHVDFSLQEGDEEPWDQLDAAAKITRIGGYVLKLLLVFGALYLFICSLSFLADGFRLVAGKKAGEVFANSEVFNNPVAGLMVGVLVTVLVQSSSTSTSITITMVGADLLTVRQAIPIIMGANIGTSVTSTIVAMGQSSDRNEFRRSFAAATVHDMFNFLTVAILLPFEASTHFLYELSTSMVNSNDALSSQEKPPDILKVVTKPFTKFVMQIDKKLINKIAAETDPAKLELLEATSMLKKPYAKCTADASAPWACSGASNCTGLGSLCAAGSQAASNVSGIIDAGYTCVWATTDTCDPDKSEVSYLFDGMYGSWSDGMAGLVMLVLALSMLCACLYAIVALLRSLLQGRIAVWLHKAVNDKMPDLQLACVSGKDGEAATAVAAPCNCCCKEALMAGTVPMGWMSGYFSMVHGFLLTIAVQSSSITTSALTPLVGVGVINLEVMYPIVLGANIGTTVTGLLAALAADADKLKYTLAVAYAHLFFNVTGIFIWYVIWPLRRVPISMAIALGNTTARYKWFPIAYIIVMFGFVPTIFVGLSIVSTTLVAIIAIIFVLGAVFVAVVNHYQENDPAKLPAGLVSWDWLPLPLRSLEPYDKICSTLVVCVKKAPPAAAPTRADLQTATGKLADEPAPQGAKAHIAKAHIAKAHIAKAHIASW